MKNFAEEIAYWYFRLNGFFIVENYVSHKTDTDGNHADSDLLCIRHKYVKETIGLNEQIIDTCRELNSICPKLNNATIAIICEVKGGASTTSSLNTSKLESCIKRFGILPEALIPVAKNKLENNSKYVYHNNEIHKIFASCNDSNIPYWTKINIDVMIEFIKERVSKYEEKILGWNHYNSELFQYLLYEARKQKNQRLL